MSLRTRLIRAASGALAALAFLIALGLAMAAHGRPAPIVGLFLVDPDLELPKRLKGSLEDNLLGWQDAGIRFERDVALIPSRNPPDEVRDKYLGYVEVGRSGGSILLSIWVRRGEMWRTERVLSVADLDGLEPHRAVIATWLLARLWDGNSPCGEMSPEQAKEVGQLLQDAIAAWKAFGGWTSASRPTQQAFRAQLLGDLGKRLVRCEPLRDLKL